MRQTRVGEAELGGDRHLKEIGAYTFVMAMSGAGRKWIIGNRK
jgi:hypothetical protein